jgi:hypothetical protein
MVVSLKWAIIVVVILGIILMGPKVIQGDYSGAASGPAVNWTIMSGVILFLSLWGRYDAEKDKK